MKGRNDITETIILYVAMIIFGTLAIGTMYCLYSFGKDGPEVHDTELYFKTELVEVVSCEKVNDAERSYMDIYNVAVILDDKEHSIETLMKCEPGTTIPVDVGYYYVDGELATKECSGYHYP